MLVNRRGSVGPWRMCGLAALLIGLGAMPETILHAEAQPADLAADRSEMRQRIRDMVGGMKDVPLPLIIEALTEHRVLPWQGQGRDTLLAVATRIEKLIEEQEVEAARMNEAGNKVENIVLEAMRELGIKAGRPKAESGRGRAAGYPDVEAEINGVAFYIEVKTFSAATIDSTQRSFYLSPTTDFKVTRDAVHLLVAVQLTPTARGAYRAQSVRWLDLSGLLCDLKYEFNASNRDLYRRESGLVIVESVPREDPQSPALAPASAPAAGLKP